MKVIVKIKMIIKNNNNKVKAKKIVYKIVKTYKIITTKKIK